MTLMGFSKGGFRADSSCPRGRGALSLDAILTFEKNDDRPGWLSVYILWGGTNEYVK
jgi:hypothetical protein